MKSAKGSAEATATIAGMAQVVGPLLTATVIEQLREAQRVGAATLECSLDLQRSTTTVDVAVDHWSWEGRRFGFPDKWNDRTVYHWDGERFEPVARYVSSLIKLVPTEWGAPTFEIDGIKMLPTSQGSPYEDAMRKVGYIEPSGKVVLDTCGGLGYFAAWCLRGQAKRVISFEKSAEVLWLRALNPWSPAATPALELKQADISVEIAELPTGSCDAILHDPPRFGIAGELYSQMFYDQLARVLKRHGKLFHYTGSPNRLTSGRDVPREVAGRLCKAGFAVQLKGDGVMGVKER